MISAIVIPIAISFQYLAHFSIAIEIYYKMQFYIGTYLYIMTENDLHNFSNYISIIYP